MEKTSAVKEQSQPGLQSDSMRKTADNLQFEEIGEESREIIASADNSI
jgi:hypothetical protein